ncbi:hypothetical protein PRZ61_14880 [Halomonas pacifica]|uniref:hypothetical protein n=1 Tax=Bisbaumannia pacifica TaxID=77098 RepID=UPI00235981E4|nr:hypothetical protein [Halomonas pacifica]MDC8804735.1 hypothetical protein [Halomonas pacifica]
MPRVAPAPLDATQPLMHWWLTSWSHHAPPMARLQLAWLSMAGETLQAELEFFGACADMQRRWNRCLSHEKDPQALGECYQSLVKEMTDAQFQRLHRVSQLPNDFRQQVWEEL